MDIQQDDLQFIDIQQLADIRDIKIDTTKDKSTRLQEYIQAIKNPYCFRCGDTIIKVSFSKEGKTFQEILQEYFTSLSDDSDCTERTNNFEYK